MELCECGCGGFAPIAKRDDKRRGAIKGQPQRFIAGHHPRAFGPNHGKWKGGKMRSRGYVLILKKDGKYEREHIAIAEAVLGRQLPPRTVVHHHNGIKSDNSKRNLVICENNSYHHYLHKRQRAFMATGNPLAFKCAICKGWDGLIIPKGSSGYHRACAAEYSRKYLRKRLK